MQKELVNSNVTVAITYTVHTCTALMATLHTFQGIVTFFFHEAASGIWLNLTVCTCTYPSVYNVKHMAVFHEIPTFTISGNCYSSEL